ncbi:MAG: hypothetical protein IK001_04660 [Lachnospiraceae bacterium]|nr:hypothetical protein [Lachnospiraceae bacterium]
MEKKEKKEKKRKLPGVYPAVKKDGTPYFRASLTYRSKHISLGSFDTAKAANAAYKAADRILRGKGKDAPTIDDYEDGPLPFEKWIAMVNLRDNGIYCRGPIYLRYRYFEYYLDRDTILRFDASELFYYTHHTIQRRGGHLFVADYGSQLNIYARYGVKNFAVCGKDYYFKNNDRYDFRSGNVVIVNPYFGVTKETVRARDTFTTRIHVRSDLIVGHYTELADAAIAYNKAADMLEAAGVRTNFNRNYLDDISEAEYKLRYARVKVSKRIVKT